MGSSLPTPTTDPQTAGSLPRCPREQAACAVPVGHEGLPQPQKQNRNSCGERDGEPRMGPQDGRRDAVASEAISRAPGGQPHLALPFPHPALSGSPFWPTRRPALRHLALLSVLATPSVY